MLFGVASPSPPFYPSPARFRLSLFLFLSLPLALSLSFAVFLALFLALHLACRQQMHLARSLTLSLLPATVLAWLPISTVCFGCREESAPTRDGLNECLRPSLPLLSLPSRPPRHPLFLLMSSAGDFPEGWTESPDMIVFVIVYFIILFLLVRKMRVEIVVSGGAGDSE